MSFRDTLKKHLTSEMFSQVVDALGDDFDFDMVPRTRLNKVIAQRNALKEQLESAGSKANPDGETDDTQAQGGASAGAKTITEEDLQKALQQLTAEKDKELQAFKVRSAAHNALKDKGAVDPDIILNSGLLKLDDLELDDTGALKGVDDAIDALAKDKAYLFGNGDTHQKGTGKGAGEDDKSNSGLDTTLDKIFGIYSEDSDQ